MVCWTVESCLQRPHKANGGDRANCTLHSLTRPRHQINLILIFLFCLHWFWMPARICKVHVWRTCYLHLGRQTKIHTPLTCPTTAPIFMARFCKHGTSQKINLETESNSNVVWWKSCLIKLNMIVACCCMRMRNILNVRRVEFVTGSLHVVARTCKTHWAQKRMNLCGSSIFQLYLSNLNLQKRWQIKGKRWYCR